MPQYTGKSMIIQLETRTGHKVRIGPGPGDASWPEIQEGGRQTANVIDRGEFFMGRIYTDLQEGDVSVNLFHTLSSVDANEVMCAILKRGSWEDAATCDPGGLVWAPSLLIRAEEAGEVWAIRWPSCRPKLSGTRAVAGNTLSFTASVVGEPLYGDAAIAWP